MTDDEKSKNREQADFAHRKMRELVDVCEKIRTRGEITIRLPVLDGKIGRIRWAMEDGQGK